MDHLPLSDIRVLDLTTTIFGPYTTQILGDFGADVIKIGAPVGDATRDVGPRRSSGMGSLFLGSNRNKRSLVLDLKSEPGRKALWRLIDTADVFVHNMRPQKIGALGFDAQSVRKNQPEIVCAGLHGYLTVGPYGGRPAYDDVVQGLSGLAGAFAARDGEPKLVPCVIVDKNAAWIAASGILAAVINRLRTGEGCYLEPGMFEAMSAWNLVEHLYGKTFVPADGPSGYPRMMTPDRRPHRTRDGYICMLACTDRQWRAFWRATGEPETASDLRFATMTARSRHIGELYAAADEALAERITVEWLELLDKAEIPVGPVNDFDDLLRDPHLDAVGFFREFEQPSEGKLIVPDTGYRMNGEAFPVHRHQPRLGEHNAELLSELGYSGGEISNMSEAGS
jgi:crotonobetainyl-CoA:carnitine CoA-transferase CaiB-like acyl-CoA transferase